ncbi:hypothetical protein GCM10010271_70930 [Streptomyces kurssanovii]|nr:hypothetical protein GCM10010271_70930 [Streptomyces kurssanovii]
MPVRDVVNQAQIGQLAWTGRVTVVQWRRHHDDFPSPVGGTTESPVFPRTAAETWLRAHADFAHFTTPTQEQRAGARLTAVQVVHAVMPGVLAGGLHRPLRRPRPRTGARAALALLRGCSHVADTLTETEPFPS